MNNTLIRNLTLATTLLSGAAMAAPLTVTVYNPGEKAIFPVSSSLVAGDKEAILIDAQFDVQNGQALVDMIKKSGKKLTTVYISAGDPDFYFGLEPVMAAFPDVKVLADQHVVDHINQTKDAKLSYWSPILGKGAPKSLTVPQVMTASHLTLDGEKIEIKEMNTPNAYLWAPSIKTAFGGVPVYSGVHVWMADSQTKAARSNWVKALNNLLALKPERVVPGHFLGTAPKGTEAVTFTRDYVERFEQELAKAKNSGQLIEALKNAYPSLPVDDGLAIGAKVNTGEMKW
ncbi:Vmh family MBL fold metallo-hydrolase [Aeromonas dhakensis]|uniref:Vmh family MBL fold metallo-hydrolase n=1 Tax=Aeromonas dhakensis TaxID=196024 RepID=UPI001BD025A0|nr:Vmh family MBL fold metallo-hydrolase [Aeromonas dhakensis]MBS4716487.1 MBL fold metallo-hydrolase [Aeromonas dhakensis]USP11163.1 Vmh family MBL fold metallo-hydrolase [Aeromonas dhakensis]BEE02350.1 MBL fold metallo-hydrolase [Aeromonas dhakensis]HDX8642964.1 MBL fold metallo-hydrolase [Aeromonas dhakensis]HDZ8878632.1 MBL fold metallo-hydrolase [Aeromonas dhakensis]